METEKREAILDAARRAFARYGFKKTSIEEIAREAKVGKGTVYLACESKEDLFYQVLHRELRAWVAQCARLIDPRVPADQLLLMASQAGIAYLDSHPLVRELLFGTVEEALPGWRDRLDELRALGLSNIMEVVKLGVRQGVFRADLDIEEIARLLQDMQIATYLFHDRPGADRQARLDRRARAGYDLVLNGLRTHARSRS